MIGASRQSSAGEGRSDAALLIAGLLRVMARTSTAVATTTVAADVLMPGDRTELVYTTNLNRWPA